MLTAGLMALLCTLAAGGKEDPARQAALKRAFPDAEAVRKKTAVVLAAQREKIQSRAGMEKAERTFSYYEARKNGQGVGYAVIARAAAKSGKFIYMVVVGPGGKIERVEVLEYKGERGSGIKRKSFLAHVAGKTIRDPLELTKDVDAVTGATISSRVITAGVREALSYLTVILELEAAAPG